MWEGTLSFRQDVIDLATNTVAFGEVVEVQFTFEIDRLGDPSAMTGVIRGRGQATRTTHGGRMGDCAVASYSRPLTSPSVDVQGALLNGNLLVIVIEPPGSVATLSLACPEGDAGQVAVPWEGTEALVRRYDTDEPGAARVQALCRPDQGNTLLTLDLTPVEVASAFARKVREQRFDERRRDALWRQFVAHRRRQYQTVRLVAWVHSRAQQLLFAHPLRAYDALQLAAALHIAGTVPQSAMDLRFCTADPAQATAANDEGLAVDLIQ